MSPFRDGQMSDILKALKEVLINARIWSHFQHSIQLKSDGVKVTKFTSHELTITLEFLHEYKDIETKRSRPPYIAKHQEILPPPSSIPKVSLHGVELLFTFSEALATENPNINSANGGYRREEPDSFEGIPRKHEFSFFEALNKTDALFPTTGYRLGHRFPIAPSSSQNTLLSRISNSSNFPISSQEIIMDYGGNANLHNQDQQQKMKEYLPYIDLLDCGLQNIFVGSTTTNHRTQTRGTPQPQLSLCELYPNIFIPSYRDNIRQRSRFIPMISKGICSMLAVLPPQSPTKLNFTNKERDVIRSQGDNDKTQIVKHFLWESMLSGAQRRGTPCKVPSLRIPNNDKPDSFDFVQNGLNSKRTTTFGHSLHSDYIFDDSDDDMLVDICTDTYTLDSDNDSYGFESTAGESEVINNEHIAGHQEPASVVSMTLRPTLRELSSPFAASPAPTGAQVAVIPMKRRLSQTSLFPTSTPQHSDPYLFDDEVGEFPVYTSAGTPAASGMSSLGSCDFPFGSEEIDEVDPFL